MRKIGVISCLVIYVFSFLFLNNGAAQKRSASWPQRVLITNDNGIDDVKIIELARAFAKISETYVVAPLENRSGSTHYLTAIRKGTLRVEPRTLGEGIHAYGVDGFPADCVMLALTGIMQENLPDLVISGINGGPNLGISWLGSGTIGAARFASFAGIPAIAVSGLDDEMPDAVEAAIKWVVGLAQSPVVRELKPPQYLTVSIPLISSSQIKGIRVAERSDLVEIPIFNKVSDEVSKNGYQEWRLEGFKERENPMLNDRDVALHKAGYIVVIPMLADEHDYEALTRLKENSGKLPAWLPVTTSSTHSKRTAAINLDNEKIPTKDAKSLQDVARFLQSEGYENIVEIEFDDFYWEVKTLFGKILTTFSFEPNTLKLHKKEPKKIDDSFSFKNVKLFSEILEAVKKKEYPGVQRRVGISRYKDTYIWKVEMYHNGANREIALDLKSGEIITENVE